MSLGEVMLLVTNAVKILLFVAGPVLIVSIIGFLLSVFLVRKASPEWAFAFGIVFLMMFVASFISMKRASPDAELRLGKR